MDTFSIYFDFVSVVVNHRTCYKDEKCWKIPEHMVTCGDLNGHFGKTWSGFEGLHGGHGYGVRSPEGARILELCVAADLVITNKFFTKCDSQLLTFRSGNACSQID